MTKITTTTKKKNSNNKDSNKNAGKQQKQKRRSNKNYDDNDDDDDDDDGEYNVAFGLTSYNDNKDDEDNRNNNRNSTKLILSSKERDNYFYEGRNEKDKELITKYLKGPHAYHNKERKKQYRIDDKDPESLSNLRDPQKRALARRRKQQSNKNKKSIVGPTESKLERHEYKTLEAATAAADAQIVLHTEMAGFIETETDMERTTKLTQKDLKNKYLSQTTARHIYDLNLSPYNGPYGMKYDRSGRYALLYGKGGSHVSMMDCHLQSLVTEFYVGDTEKVRDVCFLQNYELFGVAQKNHVYIYDDKGSEIHQLQDHVDPLALEFLPHHWLLCSIGRAGYLKYHDTSTGTLISQHRTKLGSCRIMRSNPTNAIVHCGHTNGTVTLWSPSCGDKYLAKMLCHKGSPITSLVIKDHLMITGGADKVVKLWDLRTYKELHSYHTVGHGVPTSLDLSQRNVLGIAHGSHHTTFWKPDALLSKVRDPYMHHSISTSIHASNDSGNHSTTAIETLRFRPYEDVCGIGHSHGISSIVIPGCGEPNLDTSEYHTNPYQDTKQRREATVRSLLDKLEPNMITLDPDAIGMIESEYHRKERLQDIQNEVNDKGKLKKKMKNKKRGRSKIRTQLRRKAQFSQEDATKKLRASKDNNNKEDGESNNNTSSSSRHYEPQEKSAADTAPSALKRFFT